jgi:acyl-CoA thioesterase-1
MGLSINNSIRPIMLSGDHRICFVGDSFTQGTCDPEHRGWVGRVAAAARTAGFNITAYNLGVRRDTSRDVLKRWQTECAARLPANCSAYVVFSFGANDMTDEAGQLWVGEDESVANFRAIIQAAGKQYTVAAVGPCPVGDPEQDGRILNLCSAYERAARALRVSYLPVAQHLLSNEIWLSEVAANDGSHPGAAGYELLASMVLGWPSWWFSA